MKDGIVDKVKWENSYNYFLVRKRRESFNVNIPEIEVYCMLIFSIFVHTIILKDRGVLLLEGVPLMKAIH